MVIVSHNKDQSYIRSSSICRWPLIAFFVASAVVLILRFNLPRVNHIESDPFTLVATNETEKIALETEMMASASPAKPPRNFLEVAQTTDTDKIAGYKYLPECLANNQMCTRPDAERETCRPWGHFYDTIYTPWLGKYSTEDAAPIQFVEIGFYNGAGFEAYSKYLPNAELHSMEIACLPEGPQNEGKWPWGNFAKKHPWYERLLQTRRLHCGDASDYNFLKDKWMTEMKRKEAPPLMVVVDDGSHLHDHMATSLFFWFPRIEPGGILIVEDIQPISEANKFRTHIVPQVMKDLHWCGGPKSSEPDTRCFPTIQPLLQGVHCEMHICVFVRNNEPSSEPDQVSSMTPPAAFRDAEKCLFGPH